MPPCCLCLDARASITQLTFASTRHSWLSACPSMALALCFQPHCNASLSMSTPTAVLQTSLLHQAALIKLVPLKSSLKCKGTYTEHKLHRLHTRPTRNRMTVVLVELTLVPGVQHTDERILAYTRCRQLETALHAKQHCNIVRFERTPR